MSDPKNNGGAIDAPQPRAGATLTLVVNGVEYRTQATRIDGKLGGMRVQGEWDGTTDLRLCIDAATATTAPLPIVYGDALDGPANPHPAGKAIDVWPQGEEPEPTIRTVFKFPVDVRDPQLVLPRGAQVLHIAADPSARPGAGLLQVWAEVFVNVGAGGAPTMQGVVTEQIPLLCFGTGHPIPAQPLLHMASCIDGPFVWHVFRVLPR